MGIFSGLFRSRDKPTNSYDSPSYTYFFRQKYRWKERQRPYRNAADCCLCLCESAVRSYRTAAAARLRIHG